MVSGRSRSKEFYFLDLFAGSGGFTLGLESAGFSSLGSVEINQAAQKTLRLNFGETVLPSVQKANGDVTKVNLTKLKKDLVSCGLRELDVLVGGPPCQGFSRIGRGKLDSLAGTKGSHPADPRNRLYKAFVRYLRALKPRAFIFENVPGMLSVGGQNVAEIVCRDAERAGYRVKAALMNAAWFGVPQLRERVIIIGFRNDLAIEPRFPTILFNGPEIEGHMSGNDGVANLWADQRYFVRYSCLKQTKTPKPFRTVEEAFCDLPAFTGHLAALRSGSKYKALRSMHEPLPYVEGASNEYTRIMKFWEGIGQANHIVDHFCRWTPRDFRIFRKMREGDRYPEALSIARQLFESAKKSGLSAKRSQYVPPYPDTSFKEKWRKLIRNKPSWTVTAHLGKDSYSHIHFDSKQARSITLREAARLQSFPDGFVFHGCMGDVFTQIGNAVPPLLAKAIGCQVLKDLRSVTSAGLKINRNSEVVL